jgi:hypothetical protein
MIKTAAICLVCAMGAFTMMHLHMTGQLGDEPADGRVDAKQEAAVPRFPFELAPAARGEAVAKAAAFALTAETHPTAILDRSGKLHEWQKYLQPDWLADTIEGTELVVVVSSQTKSWLSVQTYPNGAPPVHRYRYDMDAWLVEARTGKTIISKHFVTIARPVRRVEAWDLTELGDPVGPGEVIEWLREEATAYAAKVAMAK